MSDLRSLLKNEDYQYTCISSTTVIIYIIIHTTESSRREVSVRSWVSSLLLRYFPAHQIAGHSGADIAPYVALMPTIFKNVTRLHLVWWDTGHAPYDIPLDPQLLNCNTCTRPYRHDVVP